MIEIIKKRINRLEYELARFEVCKDSGKYDDMMDVYFEMKLMLETKLNRLRVELEEYMI